MKKLTSWLHALRVWLTDVRRQALHAALGTVATLAVTVGWVTDDQAALVAGLTGSALALLQGGLGLLLLRPSDAAKWFGTTGRGLVYGLAAAAGAVGIGFGLWGDDSVTQALSVVSMALTIVSSFLGVVNVQTLPNDAPRTRREYRAWLEQQ